MCVVSMVGDHYNDKWRDLYRQPFTPQPSGPVIVHAQPVISREEFDVLKRDVEEMKALLVRAKAYDEANNEPHCEIEEKVELLKRVAAMVGVSLEEVFGPAAKA